MLNLVQHPLRRQTLVVINMDPETSSGCDGESYARPPRLPSDCTSRRLRAFAAAASASLYAVGTEPFWDVLIDEHDVTFTLAGMQPVRQPTPPVIHGIAGEIYNTPRIHVNIVHGQCSDGMSDRIFPDKVQVDVDGKRFNGCGGL